MNLQRPITQKKHFIIAVSLAVLSIGMVGCSKSGGGQAKGAYAITANGGQGGATKGTIRGRGGRGGTVTLDNFGAGGGAQILAEGVANTKFQSPITVPKTADLGANPLNITTDTTIAAVNINKTVADITGATTPGQLYFGSDKLLRTAGGKTASYATDPVLSAGAPYLRINDTGHVGVYAASGNDATKDARYSGLSVASGVTLTLTENFTSAQCLNSTFGCGLVGAAVSFLSDIQNDGTIKMVGVASYTDRGLYLMANNYYGGGTVTADGIPGTGGAVADGNTGTVPGGTVAIYAANGIVNDGTISAAGVQDPAATAFGGYGGNVSLMSGGYIINNGTLDVHGADGVQEGGTAGNVTTSSASYVEIHGAINAYGGKQTDTAFDKVGGAGGNVTLVASYVINNTSTINATGGQGVGADGGNGGTVTIKNSDNGEVINSGNIDVSAGSAAAVNSSGSTSFENGGTISMDALGGSLLNSGDLTATGGDCAGADASFLGFDMNGGSITFLAETGSNGELGDLLVSGNLDVSAGSDTAAGSIGGIGGSIKLSNTVSFNSAQASSQRVALLGYVSIDANGGDGEIGGSANTITVYAGSVQNKSTLEYVAGSALNEVPINAHGGSSTATGTEYGNGGAGGHVNISTDTQQYLSKLNLSAINKAAIDISGGTGYDDGTGTKTSTGGGGGQLKIGSFVTNNSGSVNANGASDVTNGGNAGQLTIAGLTSAVNQGSVSANGGTGAVLGGNGGILLINGTNDASNGANLSVNGGNASAPTGSTGGNGGGIFVISSKIGAAGSSGTLSYNLGTGATNGTGGMARIGLTCEGRCSP